MILYLRTMNIALAKSSFGQSLEYIKMLRQSLHTLKASLYVNQSTWNSEIEKPLILKQKLETIQFQLLNPSAINQLKIKIKRWRKKKQSRDKKNREKLLKLESERVQSEKRNSEIDMWRQSLIQQTLDEKQKAQMKLEADSILEEVRKKISETQKIFQRMTVLQKLRHAKKENWVKKGLYISPDSDERFEKGLESIKNTLKDRLKVYDVEERALQVMLQSEKEVENERVQTEREKENLEILEERQRAVITSLFSDQTFVGSNYSMYYIPNDMGTLYSNRLTWDQYLVTPQDPDGSSVPTNWVFPTNPKSSDWELVLNRSFDK